MKKVHVDIPKATRILMREKPKPPNISTPCVWRQTEMERLGA